ncbi:MAG: hypothetical protein LBD11_03055 [Candidatus Peribacteria bacterium]|jgi:hypothetical protein|nr:hypothetical protein [Candidatus Peribacteria bacterium]
MKKLSLYLSAFLVAMIAQVFLITTNADYTNVGGVCAVGTTGDFESALLS